MMNPDKEHILKNLDWYELVAMKTGSCVLEYGDIKNIIELINELVKRKDTIETNILKKVQEKLTEKANANISLYNLQIVTVKNIDQIIKEILEG